MNINIKSDSTALLVMDFQNTIISNYLSEDEAIHVLLNTAELIKSAREDNLTVIYVSVGFRSGYPEVSPANKVFSEAKKYGLFIVGEKGTEIHDSVKPINEEPVVIKNRIGAFSSTELDIILKSKKIETIIMAGLTTTGVVLSTVRQAFDLDYQVVIAKDCCADPDKFAHDALIENIFPLHSNVMTNKDIKSAMS